MGMLLKGVRVHAACIRHVRFEGRMDFTCACARAISRAHGLLGYDVFKGA